MKFIDIDQENGGLIMQHMETALGFIGWSLLGAKYDNRFKNITALYSCEEDIAVHQFSFRLSEDGKLIAYSHSQFSPEIFIRYFDYQNGYVLTSHVARLKQVFAWVMTPEFALKLVDSGIRFERTARGVAVGG